MEERDLSEIMTPREAASDLRVNIHNALELMHNPTFPSNQIRPRQFNRIEGRMGRLA
jgi:hypothetical protein